jgi:hypothetical protein
MKTGRSIENLVQWAMREELPKGRAVSTSAWDLLTRFGALGTNVDGGGWRDDLGYVPGDPHPDAETIGAAIRSLKSDARFEHRLDALELFGDLAAIAGAAVDAVMRSTFNPQALVICHAVQSTRPKWDFPMPGPEQMMRPERNARGELREVPLVHGVDDDGDLVEMKSYRTAKARGLYDLAMLPRSPVVWCDPAPLSIAEARAEYLCWIDALGDLCTSLRGALQDFEPVMPQLSRLPWITGQVPQPRVLQAEVPIGEAIAATPAKPRRVRIAEVYDRRRQDREAAKPYI